MPLGWCCSDHPNSANPASEGTSVGGPEVVEDGCAPSCSAVGNKVCLSEIQCMAAGTKINNVAPIRAPTAPRKSQWASVVNAQILHLAAIINAPTIIKFFAYLRSCFDCSAANTPAAKKATP